jgi:hypothetical protein
MAKKPIPVRPTLEKNKPESSDYKNPLSDDESDDPTRKSNKKFLFFFLILMIACCAGGYGYIEYKKKKDKEEAPITAKESVEEKDPMDAANPDAAGEKPDEKEKENDNSEVIIVSNETLKSENTPTQTFPENGGTNLNEPQPEETEGDITPDEPEEDYTLDFSSENEEPLAKTEEKTEDSEDLIFTEPDEENSAKTETESKTVEAENNEEKTDSELFELSDNELEKSPEKFVAPKVRKPVKEERRQPVPQKKRIRKRKPAKKPPALNSKRISNNNTRRRPRTNQNNSTTNRNRKKTNASAKIRWKKLGNSEYQSPAGLIYGPGSREGHRFKHVLKHAKDQPDRPGKHGVFQSENQDDVFRLIDEAYQIAKKRGPPDVAIKKDRSRTVYTVNMKRKIGYIGGQVGADRNHPVTYKIRFVLEGKKVITAFPM